MAAVHDSARRALAGLRGSRVLVCRGHHDTRRRGRASRRLRKVGLANGSLLSALNKGPTTDRHLASTASVRTPSFALTVRIDLTLCGSGPRPLLSPTA